MGTVKPVRLDRPAGQSGSESGTRHDLLIQGECAFTNERDFPIALQSKALVLRFATGIEALAAPDPGETAEGFLPFQINWSQDHEIGMETAFGPANEAEGASILEQGGVNVVPFYAPVSVYWQPSEQHRLMELDSSFMSTVSIRRPAKRSKVPGRSSVFPIECCLSVRARLSG